MLIGGEATDRDESWYFINEVREIYSLYGQPDYIGFFNHRTGHAPSPEAVSLACDGLNDSLGRETEIVRYSDHPQRSNVSATLSRQKLPASDPSDLMKM